MYTPSPFLISSAALTSIFSFFFGGYFQEREKAYRLWIRFMAYNSEVDCEKQTHNLCAELESKDRVFRQAKGLLKILLLTLVIEYVVFHFYSLKYILETSPYFEPDALHTYICFSILIGIIVLINGFEMFYIVVAISISSRFPFFNFRRRVTGQDRLSMLWRKFNCHALKSPQYSSVKIPVKFYHDLEEKK
ncbi:hypothetical protein ACFL6N_05020 [Thermodesulfobacteriota bacterium]